MHWGSGASSKPTEKICTAAPLATGHVVNGLRTLPEPEALVVNRQNIAAYTLPAEAFFFQPPKEAVVCVFKNGDRERKIYNNIELDETEQQNLKKLQEEARAQQFGFSPSITAMTGRYLSRARGDASAALKYMQATQDWRNDFFKDGPITDESIIEDLRHGIVYFCGRDSALRPTLVIRATRIPSQWYKEKRVDKLIRLLIFCMEYMLRYMTVPGRIENNCVIVDLKGLSLTQVPISPLKDVYKVMSHHYMGRVYRFYVCNASWALLSIASAVKAILTDRQRQKLVFVDDLKDLKKDWAADQLEEDLGGRRPVDKVFFPFPLQAGPFEAGSVKRAEANAPRNLHEALTKEMVLGRVWDCTLSRSENMPTPNLEPRFVDSLLRYGIAVPQELVKKLEASKEAETASDGTATNGVSEAIKSPGAEEPTKAASTRSRQDAMEPKKVEHQGSAKSDDISPASTAVPTTVGSSAALSVSTTASLDACEVQEQRPHQEQPVEMDGASYGNSSWWTCNIRRCMNPSMGPR